MSEEEKSIGSIERKSSIGKIQRQGSMQRQGSIQKKGSMSGYDSPLSKKKSQDSINSSTKKQRDNKYVKQEKVNYLKKSEGYEIQKTGHYEGGSEAFCCKFDQNDKYVAVAFKSGYVKVYNVKSEQLAFTIKSTKPDIPFSFLAWRPQSPVSRTKNVIVTVNAEGEIQHFHLNSDKLMNHIQQQSDLDNQLFSIDYNPEGTQFVVSGCDPSIKIYDEEYRKIVRPLDGEHQNRVFCVKYDKKDSNIVYSGGWDKKVNAWDLRTEKLAFVLPGPFISGDSIDSSERYILTGSQSESYQIQLWDKDTHKAIPHTIDTINGEAQFLNSAQFGKGNLEDDFIITGGRASNQEQIELNGVKLFDYSIDIEPVISIDEIPLAVNCVDFSHNGEMFAFAGADGVCRIFKTNLES